jgi:sugar lactone lactonase YvrE
MYTYYKIYKIKNKVKLQSSLSNNLNISTNPIRKQSLFSSSIVTVAISCFFSCSAFVSSYAAIASVLYVTENTSPNSVKKFDSNGNLINTITFGSSTGLAGLAVDAGGNLYVSHYNDGTIDKFTASGTLLNTITISPAGSEPKALAIDSGGNLYETNYISNTIQKFTASGTLIPTQTITQGVNNPTGLAIDLNGNIYVGNYSAGTIKKFRADGTPDPSFAVNVNLPAGLAVDASGNIYVGSNPATGVSSSDTVQKFDSNGKLIYTIPTSVGISAPTGLAIDPTSGILYVANFGNNTTNPSGTIQEFNSLTGALLPSTVNSAVYRPYAIAIGNDPTSVPEPFTIIGTLMGGAAACRMRKRYKARNQM